MDSPHIATGVRLVTITTYTYIGLLMRQLRALIPTIEMDMVEEMLRQIVARFKTELISIMEELEALQSSLDHARNSNPSLKLNWGPYS